MPVFSLSDHHNNKTFDVYGRSILEAMPSPSIILVNGDINKCVLTHDLMSRNTNFRLNIYIHAAFLLRLGDQ